ncbi:MAG: outer membrane beta-barrel protein [Limisphaerales bacterium]
MKNILTTAGIAAVAVAGFQTQCAAQAVSVDDSKWWHVSAALRGFYDDNYTIAPKNLARESFGFEIRPGFDVGHQGEQYIVKLSGYYSGRWFEDRDDEQWDHGFMADANGEYRFTENHILRFSDNFSYSSEPTLLDRGSTITLLRADGTNIRNLGDLKYVGQFTPLFGLEVGYGNTFYDFENEGAGSYSALLDRVEHLIKAETRWTLTPTLAGILGYWYEDVGFTGDEAVAPGLMSDSRDSFSHYFITGADYTVSPQCFISVRGGAQNVTYDGIDGEPDQWNGFGDISTTFEYAEDSFFRVGGRYGRNRTDFLGPVTPTESIPYTVDQETAVAYGTVSHKLTEQLTARGSAQLQFGSFNGGLYDNQDEGFYILGLSLTYELNQYLALETGYNYDRLDSDDSQRSYSRNRVFLGVRGQF